MQKLPFASFSMLLIFLATGCASQRGSLDKTDFRTRITGSGLKHFEVRVKRDKPDGRQVKNLDPQQRQRQELRLSSTRLQKRLQKAADRHIEESGFCQNGYWIMETNTYSPLISLRGECNEPARDEDIRRFPNTIEQW